MADKVSPEQRSRNMSKIKSRGMKPEMAVRRLAHGLGYRYRLHRHDLPGRPDMVFPGRRKIIFVHGCFWHQHPDPECKLAHRPRSNSDYWGPKLRRNQERDTEHQLRLREIGWDVLVVWECEVKTDSRLSERITRFLNGPAQLAAGDLVSDHIGDGWCGR